MIAYEATPIYSNKQVVIVARPELPLPEDVGFANSTNIFCVRFKNESPRAIRLKTVRVFNNDPIVYTIDLPPNTISQPVNYFGPSTRMLAVWAQTEKRLISLQPLPVTQSQTISYREFGEIRDGVVVTVGILMPQRETLNAPVGADGS